jgi:hypothetical protein
MLGLQNGVIRMGQLPFLVVAGVLVLTGSEEQTGRYDG